MITNDELSRLRAAFAAPEAAVKAAPEPEACPPSDKIWLAVRGELPPDELREIVDHIATCPACAEDWRIAMAFEEESRVDVPAPAPRPFVATVRQRAWMAIAASVLVAFIGFRGFELFRPKPEYRGGDETGIQSLVEGPSLPRDAFVLRWTPVAGAEAYNLEVQTVGLDHLYGAEGLTTTTCQVPPASLAHLRSGDKVHWMVTPIGRDGGLLQGRTLTTTLR